MTATGIEIQSRLFDASGLAYPNVIRVNSSLAYSDNLSTAVRTLSTNQATSGQGADGLIYTPTLASSSPCVNISAPYVPTNVTRIGDLPSQGQYATLAFAPWLTPACVQEYLSVARVDGVAAFLFYLPGQGIGIPPQANDAAWDLHDGGRWKSDNPFPVYAVPSSSGYAWMTQSAQYSGNFSTLPQQSALESAYGSGNFIRLYADVDLSVSSGLPSLWIFLVIILAVLIAIVAFISTILHFIQRHRRRGLRRRVANGEVDLEVIGVKRLMVPNDVLQKMPLYTYSKTEPTATPPVDKTQTDTSPSAHSMSRDGALHGITKLPTTLNQFDQPTCAICIDDFVVGESQVRQLPCHHIFHAECVDGFLTGVSSLCPLCKKSALPVGYCPDLITNAMVRRERLLNRAREQAARLGPLDQDASRIVNHHQSARQRFLHRTHRSSQPNDVEMAQRSTRPPSAENPGRTDVPTATTGSGQPSLRGADARRERARRRVDSILGPNAAPLDLEEDRSRSGWRKILHKVFPRIR